MGEAILRFHFGGDDLARTRVGTSVGPLTETLFSLHAVAPDGPDPLLAGWRRRISRDAAASLRVLGELQAPAWTVDLVAADRADVVPGFETSPVASGWMIRATLDPAASRLHMVEAFHAYHRVAVRPYWDAIRTLLEAAFVRLVRIAGERGVEEMLSSLHPAVEWRPPALQIHRSGTTAGELHLRGRGLVVVPSFFGRPHAVPAPPGSGGPSVLFVPVTPELTGNAGIWPAADAASSSLGALLGRTRAAVLQAVGMSACTTSELAERCEISISSASQHATVLREAGLIRTERRRSSVVHSLTSMGEILLEGPNGPADRFALR
jgi:hypothetical protein